MKMYYKIIITILFYVVYFTYSYGSTKTYPLCDICYCPNDTSQNPYIINCKALQLADIPPWDEHSMIDKPEISNIHLDLNNNNLVTIPLIAATTNIQELDIGNNHISGIEAYAFSETKGLKRLSLSNNIIEILHPNTFSASTKEEHLILEILDLSNNRIHHLDGDLFEDVPNLVELNLALNPFGVLDVSTTIALNSLSGLQYLNMADTGIREFPDILINPIRQLKKLDLSNNLMKNVPQVLKYGTKMTELILSNNLIKEFDKGSFNELSSLQTLVINNMPQLTLINKGTFHSLTSLKTLLCNNNEMLSVIEIGAFLDSNGYGTLALKKVELRGNNLTTVSKELLRNLSLKYLDLRDNPINCSCDIEWIKHENETLVYLNETKCYNPPEMIGQTLADINLDCENSFPKPLIRLPPVVANVYVYFLEAGLVIGFSILVVMGIIIRQARKNIGDSSRDVESNNGPQSSTAGQFSDVKYMPQIDEDDE